MNFGIDNAAADTAIARGLVPQFGTFWVGSWTQKYGWTYAEEQLRAASARNMGAMIQWWYWGDDISPTCVENGCYDSRQGVFKDKATWYRMSNELADLIVRTVGTRETLVVVETEFNKNGIENYEAFDGYLAEHAAIFHSRGNIKVIVSFGNWGRDKWSRFDRAVAGADYLGTQLLRSSVRDSATYTAAIDTLIAGARDLQSLFGKPSYVTDLGLSSYPSSSYEPLQAAEVDELFLRLSELKSAGVRGIMYRMLVDDPNFDTSNYHGMAERYWGLLRSDLSQKPAFPKFVAGVQAERAGATPTGGGGGGTTCTVPGAPTGVWGKVQKGQLNIGWSALPEPVATYIVEVGTANGLSDVAIAYVTTTSVKLDPGGVGTYYIRVRARNACGDGPASTEAVVRVRR